MRRKTEQALLQWRENSNRKPLLLRGVRQSGKTYLLKKLFAPFFPASHYFDLKMNRAAHAVFSSGDLNPKSLLSELEFVSGKTIDINSELLILDEIQACPKALTALKYFCELMPGVFIAAAGSLIGVHLSQESFPVGKIDMVNVDPLDFREFLSAIGEDRANDLLQEAHPLKPFSDLVHNRIWQLYGKYLAVGGMPETVKVYTDNIPRGEWTAYNAVRAVQEHLVEGWISDIAKHSGKANSLHIEQVWKSLPSQLGREFDGNAKRFRFKGVIPGRKSYRDIAGPIAWLEKARMVNRVPVVNRGESPVSVWEKQSLFKLFVHDTAILRYMAGIPLNESRVFNPGFYKGWVAENAVAQELVANGFKRLHCWTERNSEIEFLLDGTSGPIPVEVKSGRNTRSRSLSVFREKYDPEISVKLGAWNFSASKKVLLLPLYAAFKLSDLIN
ncbi:MAG: AAA family ATPase [Candidatus Aegiribacteria sp.]|nr:AAA family ATPase [Candidatus Aegiribacteria sp.]